MKTPTRLAIAFAGLTGTATALAAQSPQAAPAPLTLSGVAPQLVVTLVIVTTAIVLVREIRRHAGAELAELRKKLDEVDKKIDGLTSEDGRIRERLASLEGEARAKGQT